jgi:hypothetical protein
MNAKGLASYGFSLVRRPLLTLRVMRQISQAVKNRTGAGAPHLKNAADWLLLAQRECPDGAGYSRRFRMHAGWDRGYVETTGYIIPTMLAVAKRLKDDRYRGSALAAGEWLLTRQNPDGSFNEIDHQTPQAFDTGQVLMGLNALGRELPGRTDYRSAAGKAAAWLSARMNADGTWTNEAFRGCAHTYYSRSGAALLETGIMQDRTDFVTAAHRHLRWVLSRQRQSGWFDDCEFEPGRPALLHTIVYVMEGLLQAHALSGVEDYYQAALRSARGLQAAVAAQGSRFGVPAAYYTADWVPASDELCITGLAQWAGVCQRFIGLSDRLSFESQASRCLELLGALQIRAPGSLHGALPNVIPWYGSYGKMGAYNWNNKFYLDALLQRQYRS